MVTPSVETINDYMSELSQVLSHQMPGFNYNHGDHEVRKLCGAVFPFLDGIDERPLPDFDHAGDDYLPPELGDIVVDISENNAKVQAVMRKYAKDNPDIAQFMMDVVPDTPKRDQPHYTAHIVNDSPREEKPKQTKKTKKKDNCNVM